VICALEEEMASFKMRELKKELDTYKVKFINLERGVQLNLLIDSPPDLIFLSSASEIKEFQSFVNGQTTVIEINSVSVPVVIYDFGTKINTESRLPDLTPLSIQETAEHFSKLEALYHDGKIDSIGFDLETTGLDPYFPWGEITTVSFYDDFTKVAGSCVFRHPELYYPKEKVSAITAIINVLKSLYSISSKDALDTFHEELFTCYQAYRDLENTPTFYVTSELEDSMLECVFNILQRSKGSTARSVLSRVSFCYSESEKIILDYYPRLMLLHIKGLRPQESDEFLTRIDSLVNTIPLVGHNIKFDIKWMHSRNIGLKARVFRDSMISEALLYSDTNRGKNSLGDMCARYLSLPKTWKDDMSEDPRIKTRSGGVRYDRVNLSKHANYAAVDAVSAYLLNDYFKSVESHHKVDIKFIQDLMKRAIPVFTKAEVFGASIDVEALRKMDIEFSTILETSVRDMTALPTASRILSEIGLTEVNPAVSGARSNVNAIMFRNDGYRLKVMESTTAGYPSLTKAILPSYVSSISDAISYLESNPLSTFSSSQTGPVLYDELPRLRESLKFVTALNNYKTVSNLKKTYINHVLKYEEQVGYVDKYPTEFKVIDGTVTGRLSSGFHLMPRDSDIKKMLISAWSHKSSRILCDTKTVGLMRDPHCRPLLKSTGHRINGGGLLFVGDYSQLELYIAAILSGETEMIKAFRDGEDIHAFNASLIFPELQSLTVDEIKTHHSSKRTQAKQVSFGLLYQKNPDTDELKTAYDLFFERFKEIKRWIDEQKRIVRRDGVIYTKLGRARFLPHAKLPSSPSTNELKSKAERQAVNTPIQSLASDVALLSCVNIAESLEKFSMKSMMIGGVHDSILVDIYPGELYKALDVIVSQTSDKSLEFLDNIKLNFDLGIGVSWGRQLDILSYDSETLSLRGGQNDLQMLIDELRYGYEVNILETTLTGSEKAYDPLSNCLEKSGKETIAKLSLRSLV